MDFLDGIRIQALLDVMDGDFLYHYRKVCRWYSTTFHTPLYEVDSLPMEHVLQNFFEFSFERMSKAERKKLAVEITETPEETKARKRKEKSKSDDAFLKRIKKQAKQDESQEAMRAKLALEAAQRVLAESADKEMVVAPQPPALPEIKMNFDERGNLLMDDEESVPAPPPLPRK